MDYCIAVYSSLTYAIKAQKALSAVYISAQITKLDATQAKEGCTYGVEFLCSQQKHVKEALSAANVRARRYIGNGG